MSWKGQVESLVHRIQDNYMHVGNSAKADILERELNKMFSGDFYILVYNDCGGYDKHSFNAATDQTIYSFRRGKCNVVIYRSLEWKKDNQPQIKKQVESCVTGVVPNIYDYQGFPGTLMETRIYNTGFIGMIAKRHDVEVRYFTSDDTKYGPGWWTTVNVYDTAPMMNTGRQFVLIAGWE
ncbi:hypothetical protein GCK72_020840 [Caenorhabditis remanei]|uniref:Uncharacterized protein n=1 Tax=Caenorhabditis remanei TaxID=31234 RepID=A0A6A5GGK3_CAERE|nr:hypothetical protein GCK72_020840 [Caenorhabditis remanei]KAF1754280.1 hypothetical protein GCK72_020840 [Caenorhabditis remanei]